MAQPPRSLCGIDWPLVFWPPPHPAQRITNTLATRVWTEILSPEQLMLRYKLSDPHVTLVTLDKCFSRSMSRRPPPRGLEAFFFFRKRPRMPVVLIIEYMQCYRKSRVKLITYTITGGNKFTDINN
jgi:hypothetical protein